MVNHHLHIHPKPFKNVQSGKKIVESRLYDDKRRTYRIGDGLVFTNRGNPDEIIETTITALYREKSFQELFLNENTLGKFSTTSLQELLDEIELYYSEDDQKKYGVIGVEFVVKTIK